MTGAAAQTGPGTDRWNPWSVGVVLAIAAVAAVVGVGLAGFLDGLLDVPEVARYVNAIEASPLIGAIGAVVLIVVLAVVWRAPLLCLYVILALLPFQFLGGGSARGTPTLPKILVNGSLAGAVIVAVVRHPTRLRAFVATPLGRAYAWFLATIALGILIGLAEDYPRFDWLRESNWYCFYFLALAVALLVTGWNELLRLVMVLGAFTVVAQFDAFRLFATGSRFTRGEFENFFRAAFSQSASWMLFLSLALGIFAMARGARLRGTGWLVLSGVFGLGAFLNFGRTEWAATLLGSVITVALVRRVVGRRTAAASSLLFLSGVAAVAVAVAKVTGRDLLAALGLARAFAVSIIGGSDLSASGRLAEIQGAVLTWWARPFGAGLGAPIQAVWGMDQNPAMPYYIHDSYANTLVKLGPLGLAALVWVLYQAARSAREAERAAVPASTRHAVALSLIAAIFKAAFLALAVPVLSTSDAILHIAFVIGAAAVLSTVSASVGPNALPSWPDRREI